MSAFRDPIFEERWREIAAREKGEEPVMDQAISTYLDIRVALHDQPELTEKVTNLEQAIIRYIMTMNNLAIVRLEVKREEIEHMDQSRRLAHNRLADELNILSREFARFGLNNRWREKIGQSPYQITQWAEAVYPVICQKESKGEN